MGRQRSKKVNPTADGRNSRSRTGNHPKRAGGNGTGNNGAQQDRRLVDRCLAGDAQAWEQLFRSQHPGLLAAAKRLLRGGGDNADLVEEIAARVWLTLLSDRCRVLDRYDPARDSRLEAFLAGVARFEIKQYLRAEKRRQGHESAAGQESAAAGDGDGLEMGLLLGEFAATLGAAELEFVEEFLLSRRENAANGRRQKPSPAAIWQRRHRLYGKLKAFLKGE